ncbi:MAG: response regulator [Luteolibacter sp.]
MHSFSHLLTTSSQADLENNHRILVVDDNEAIHDDFRKILGTDPGEAEFDAEEAEIFGEVPPLTPRLKFELTFASQGAQALELVVAAEQSKQRFSLVFMDVRMPPGWDGLETTCRLWEVDPDLQVVICTAYSDKSWEQMMGKLANPERVLILKKPFDTIEVLQLAHALTEKWSLLQAARRNKNELERLVSERTQALVAANSQLEIETAGHKAAAECVREQAMLLEKARDAIMVRGLDDTVLFWNRGAEELYGWTAAEAMGREIFELIHDGVTFNEVVVTARVAVMKKGSWIGELSQKTKDGRTVMTECHWTLVHDDAGQPKSILAINTDITEKKQLEAKYLSAQRMESIGTLAGGIAHDLNNILQPITLGMDLLRDRLADPSSLKILDLVSQNTGRASSLVRQVLSFARGTEGERTPIRPNELAGEISSIIRQTFPKNIEFRLCPVEDEWLLMGDSTQLHQVLLNFCVNARDAMHDGGLLTLTVENRCIDEHTAAIQPDAAPGRHVVLTVTDTGTGIPAALVEKIWDPFFTTKEQGKGTGLGLSTTLSIVRGHGGFITMETKEGRGTSFHVFLPAGESASSTDSEGAHTEDDSDLQGHGELILVVDDEAPIVSMLRHTLDAFDYRVISASDGASGLRTYFQNKNEIRAVITDMVMPGMDGPAMIAELRKANPDVRIIATTGMATEANIEAITRLGVKSIISKPCAASVILDALKEVLSAKSPALH